MKLFVPGTFRSFASRGMLFPHQPFSQADGGIPHPTFDGGQKKPVGLGYMGVNPKIWENPQIIHLFIGLFIIFTIHFGGPPLFLETSI